MHEDIPMSSCMHQALVLMCEDKLLCRSWSLGVLSSVTAAVHAAEQLQAKGAGACQVVSVAVEPLVVVTASFLTEQAVVHMLYTLSYLDLLHLPWTWRNQVQQQQTTDNQ